MGFYTESAKQLIASPLTVPEFMMECSRIDHILFEGMIELDFAEVYNESGVITLTEADGEEAQKAVGDAEKTSIKTIFNKFLETLKGVFEKISGALDKFFSQTLSLVNSKIINDPKAKDCKTKDIWYGDYFKKCAPVVQLGTYDDYLKAVKDYYEKIVNTDVDGMISDTTKLTDGFVSYAEKLSSFTKFPTTVEENESVDAEYKIEPVELGSKSSEFSALQKDLSPAGISGIIKVLYSKLKTPDEYIIKVEKLGKDATDDQKDENKKAKGLARSFAVAVFGVKLDLMRVTGKIISNGLKIGRRNYKEIAACVKGTAAAADNADNKEATTKAEEAAFLAGQFSDLFCESVFEF